MKKNFLVIGIIILIIVIIVIYIINNNKINKTNENNNSEINNNLSNLNNNNPKEIVSLLELPTPDSIIFYHNGAKKAFVKGSDEFNEIIKLNNKRDSGYLSATKLWVDINWLLQNTDILEYTYQNYNSVYFNLIKDDELEKDNKKLNWVSVGYDSEIFKQFVYSVLYSVDELINYLYSLK